MHLASAPLLRRALAANALHAVRSRTWDAALHRLASGYRAAIETAAARRAQGLARAA